MGMPKITSQEQAAIVVQKNIRRKQCADKYRVFTQKYYSYPNYNAVGNDPVIPIDSLTPFYSATEKSALIGTSKLRSLTIAAHLGNENCVPKIIIIDINKNVCHFWRALRDIFINDKKEQLNDVRFLSKFEELLIQMDEMADFNELAKNISSDHPSADYPNQDPIKFMQSLIKNHGFNFIRKMILHTSIIGNRWDDEKTLLAIKNILSKNNITRTFTYTSNIFACIHPCETERMVQLLANIDLLKPIASIHTNRCNIHQSPNKIYIFKKNDGVNKIGMTLFDANTCTEPKNTTIYTVLFCIVALLYLINDEKTMKTLNLLYQFLFESNQEAKPMRGLTV